MRFKFSPTILNDYKREIKIISGDGSLYSNGEEYLIITDDKDTVDIFKIKFSYSCSPFKEAQIINQILAVGHEQHFYLYDLTKSKNFMSYEVEGYFGGFYVNDGLFYVTDACGIHCIDNTGKLLWHNDNIAIDGIDISKFTDTEIQGNAELDPPGGWKGFILNKATGELIK